MMIGVGEGAIFSSEAGVGLGVETITVGSEEHALKRTRPAKAIPSRSVLVVVT